MQRAIILIAFVLINSSCYSQQKKEESSLPSKPKLIIGIVVDQMRYDYIDRYWKKFGEDGFKRLVNEGCFLRNCHYNYVPTETAPGHASIYTGTTPSVHGIIANEWCDKKTGKEFSSVADAGYVTVEDTLSKEGKASPSKLLSSTITDEFWQTYQNSKIISISLKDRAAILPGGKHAKAFWFDDKSGNWISSSYYFKDNKLPQWVHDFNTMKYPDLFLKQGWELSHPLSYYSESVDSSKYEGRFSDNNPPEFPYHFTEKKYKDFKATPFGNHLIAMLAKEALVSEHLGKNSVPDFLCISFSSTDYVGHQFGINSVEVEETYLKLDEDLSSLLKNIDSLVGKNNVLIFLTADHGAVPNPQYLMDKGEQAGFINPDELKSGLKKLFHDSDSDSILLDLKGYQVYLNHELAAKRNLNADSLSNETKKFLMHHEGIAIAMTVQELKQNTFDAPEKTMIKNGYNKDRSGDVLFTLKQNWIIWSRKTGTTHGMPYEYDTHVPLIFYGWKIKKGNTETSVHPIDISPTISSLLGIGLPDGASGKPIEELIK
jgi:predicted AlkP superfamily pyrophosphatase or phosphodiesterase